MTRNITSAVAAELDGAHVRACYLVELYFDSGTSFATNAAHRIAWNGNTYLGIARMGAISVIEEGTDLQARTVELTLSGIPAELRQVALAEKYRGRAAIIRKAMLDANYAVIADPVVVWQGAMNNMRMAVGSNSTIFVTCDSRMIDWERARVRRWNNADQQSEFPADRFFEFATVMAQKELLWGVPNSGR